MDAGDVAQAVAVGAGWLDGVAERDWAVGVPGLEWTVAQTVAHVGDVLFWYAMNVAAGPRELSTEVDVRPSCPPDELAATVRAFGTLLVSVLTTAPPDVRGYHPWGVADVSGFAAMGCNELVVHAHDAARGLGLPFKPPAGMADRVLRRLFPEAPTGTDPWQTLLWANGRQPLGDLPQRTRWRWHSAPLT